MTSKLTSNERLAKILSETQATIMEHNSRCVRGSVEVDARLFESMIMELKERRKAELDSEPVAWTWHYREQWHVTSDPRRAEFVAKDGDVVVLSLYRHAQPAPVAPVCTCPSGDGSLRWPCPVHPGNSPAIPDGYVMVPKEATLEMIKSGAGAASNGMLIPGIYKAMLAAAECSIPMISDRWIPVSEKMPPSRHEVLVGRWWGEKPRWCCKWATYIPGHPDAQSSGWLIPGASWTPTHWMPLPAAPQEDINALIPLVSRNEQEVK